MARIALDPTPYNQSLSLLDFPDKAASLGYEYLQLTPNPDLGTHFHHPKLDRSLVATLKKRASDAGVTITSVQPVQRFGGPEEHQLRAAIHNAKAYIRLAAELDAPIINTEFSGRPEREEESENCFYRAMEELIPVLETEGVTMNFDPHPDDFVENGLDAWRILRSLNSERIGFVYVGAHAFHYVEPAESLLPVVGAGLKSVFISDSFDHHRSHGLRYISNPPGNTARVHQHLKAGDGDVNFTELFGLLHSTGYLDAPDALLVSNVFAEDAAADEVSRYQLETIRSLIG
jgi:myo-inositol catabolism protein IolH